MENFISAKTTLPDNYAACSARRLRLTVETVADRASVLEMPAFLQSRGSFCFLIPQLMRLTDAI